MNLTRYGYLFAGLVALTGMAGQWWGGAAAHVWLLLAAALVAALLVERWQGRRAPLAAHRQVAARAYLGRPLTGQLRLHNHDHRPMQVETEDAWPAGLAGEPPRQTWRLPVDGQQAKAFTAVPRALGQLTWQDLYARTLGLFRLAWWPRRLPAAATLTVVPDRLHGGEAHAATQVRGERDRPQTGSGHELLGLRDYRPGDPLRSIDWKATARSGRQTVRLFTQEQHLELVIAIDAGRRSQLQAGHLTRLQHAINVAARLAEKAEHGGDRVSLIAYADRVLTHVNGLRPLREALQHLHPQPGESNPLPAVMQLRQRVRQRSLVVLLTDLDEADLDGQLHKAISLLTPKHLPMVACLKDDAIEALQHDPVHHWLDPYHALAAMEHSVETRRAALHIERLGGIVVRTRPAQLDGAVQQQYQRLRQRRRV